jgi:hypothetical protein
MAGTPEGGVAAAGRRDDMNQKPKVLATLVDLYEHGVGTIVVDSNDLSRPTGASVNEVEAVVHQLWSEDYLAYEGSGFRLTERGYRKYIREVSCGPKA